MTPIDETQEERQFRQICQPILESLKTQVTQVLVLLRGDGPDPGIVGHIRSHGEKIDELRKTVFGAGGLKHTVDEITVLTKSERSTRREIRALLYSILGGVLVAVILGIGYFMLDLRSRHSPPGDQPGRATSTANP